MKYKLFIGPYCRYRHVDILRTAVWQKASLKLKGHQTEKKIKPVSLVIVRLYKFEGK